MNVYEMKLHDEITESPWYITRVPGGWTYLHNKSGTSPVFVPFNNDLQETPKIKESQKTDTQQTQPEIVRVLNKWLYPETRGDIMDLTHETKLLVEQLSAVE